MTNEPQRKRVWLPRILVVLAAIGIFGVTALVLQVDDWSRDFSTNTAQTSSDAPDRWMRPRKTTLNVDETEKLVRSAARDLRGWQYEDSKPIDESADEIELHFTRQTLILRFVDDVRVNIKPDPTGALITAQSSSRKGKGDLGQNPRNIRELMRAIDEELNRRGSNGAEPE